MGILSFRRSLKLETSPETISSVKQKITFQDFKILAILLAIM